MSVVVEIDAQTGEALERPMTADEQGQRAIDEAEAAEAAAQAKAARDTALAKLTALGLTVDDLAALGL